MRKQSQNEPLSDVERVFEQQRLKRRKEKFKSSRRRLFLLAVVSGFCLVFGFYYFSSAAKVSGVTVTGNYWLSDKEILKLSGINENTRTIFLFEGTICGRIESHPLIDSVTLFKTREGQVQLTVHEKELVGYRYLDKPEIVTKDGELIEMSDDLTFLISRLPLIVGFDQPQSEEEIAAGEIPLIERLASAMKNVEQEKIEAIAEIHQFVYSYDEYGILCIMQDGNEVYGSFYSMEMLNRYNQVASALEAKKNCIYIDEMSGNPYTSLCPEEKEALENSDESDAEDQENEENPAN